MGAVFILGMHRSGTSCLAGSLQQHGLYLGEVFEQNPHNVKGNRENADILRLNDEVLAFSRGSWNRPSESLAWTDDHRQRRDAILSGFERKAPGAWGAKDPRFLLTLPFWSEGLGAVPHAFAATFRHPLCTALSLHHRDGMPLQEGLRLWAHYNSNLRIRLGQGKCPLFCFDAPFDEMQGALSRIAAALGLDPQPEVQPPFADPTLRHENETGWDGVPEPMKRLYDDLREIYRRQAQELHPVRPDSA